MEQGLVFRAVILFDAPLRQSITSRNQRDLIVYDGFGLSQGHRVHKAVASRHLPK